MRYALVSDIHANLQAWNAVLTDIATQRVDRILCLGDIVGYGPNPSEVLASLYRHVDGFCMGNHDAVICGKLDASLFHDHAREMIQWTRRQLSDKAVRFLGQQPLTISGPGFRCTHGDYTQPAAFLYVDDPELAAPNWHVVDEPLLFLGHTHVPALYVIGRSGVTYAIEPQNFVLEPGKRYLVNPGSVGNPRNGDALATYCIYDSDAEDGAGTVCWHVVPFDLDACRAAIRAAGLNTADTGFLALDPRRRLSTVREAVDFSPARNAGEQAQGVTAVGDLEKLTRSANRWKKATILATLIGVLGTAVALGVAWLRSPEPDGSLLLPRAPLSASPPASVTGNWLPAFPVVTDGQSLAGWRVQLDEPARTQLDATQDASGASAVRITVTGNHPAFFRIESAPVLISRSNPERFTLRSRWQREETFHGNVRFGVEQLETARAGGYTVLVSEFRNPPPVSPIIRFTTEASRRHASARYVRAVIEGEYSGTATISAPTLTPVP